MTQCDLAVPPAKLGFLTIETTTWCNLACAGCSRTVGMAAGAWSNIHMPASQFARIMPNLPRAQQASLHGVGEPTLNPDIVDIIGLAKGSGRFDEILLVSNGQNKNPGIYRRMMEAGLDRLHISVDSLVPDIAEKCRKGTRLGLLRDTLAALHEMGLPITINIVASRFNQQDIPNTLSVLNGFGPAEVLVQQYIDLGNPDGCLDDGQRGRLRATLTALRADLPNLRLNLHGMMAGTLEEICSSPWTSLAVTVEGFLTPCCVNFDPAVLRGADLARRPFNEIWVSAAMQDFLRDYLIAAPAFCAGCHMNGRPIPPQAPLPERRGFVTTSARH